MKTYKLASIIVVGLFLCVYAFILPNCRGADPTVDYSVSQAAEKKGPTLSVETLGAIRHVDFTGKPIYGAGVDVALAFNKFVALHVRAISYETDHWGGGVLDEGSLLVEAKLFTSDNGKLSLGAIGGGHYDVERGDFGFGIGARAQWNLSKRFSLFGQYEVRAFANGPDDGLGTAGVQLSF